MEKKVVLITGASGVLGSALLESLDTNSPYKVRLMRHSKPPVSSSFETVVADLASGEGLADALAGVDTVMHLASNSRVKGMEQVATQNLLEAAGRAGVSHFFFQSIVGIDRVPFRYYREKLAAEELVKASGLPWSILRATQFHQFIDLLLSMADKLPVLTIPTDFKVQSVEVSEVAPYLLKAMENGPSGYMPEVGGPQILSLGEMARSWKAARHLKKPVLPLPLPGKLAAAYRQGNGTCPEGLRGTVTWEAWLREKYAASGQPASTLAKAR